MQQSRKRRCRRPRKTANAASEQQARRAEPGSWWGALRADACADAAGENRVHCTGYRQQQYGSAEAGAIGAAANDDATHGCTGGGGASLVEVAEMKLCGGNSNSNNDTGRMKKKTRCPHKGPWQIAVACEPAVGSDTVEVSQRRRQTVAPFGARSQHNQLTTGTTTTSAAAACVVSRINSGSFTTTMADTGENGRSSGCAHRDIEPRAIVVWHRESCFP